MFGSWGMSLIGMTTSPEAFLAAEAEDRLRLYGSHH
ncbi:MAG: hypothetical protein M5U34_34900 [Chloroflexi bacterium]|nr:hypothetical protein [Chloroflexota bacterium]